MLLVTSQIVIFARESELHKRRVHQIILCYDFKDQIKSINLMAYKNGPLKAVSVDGVQKVTEENKMNLSLIEFSPS